MSIWYKKTLGLLGLGLATTMISSSVVSCGAASFDAILNRIVDKTKYYGNYTLNVSSWNTAHSMQAEDSRIWSNTYDTFLSTDQYGRIFGSLAISEYGEENGSKGHVGKMEDGGRKWTYAMREMNWVNTKGNIVEANRENIVLDGVLSAAEYALNPSNNSDVSELWVSFIQGGAEVQQLFKDDKEEEAKDIIRGKTQTSDGKYFGIHAGQKDGSNDTIVFELTKQAPYFESLLTYSVFSPIPDSYKDAVVKYQDALFNGAYYTYQADANSEIILKKNNHYALKDSTNIEELHFNYVDGASASKERTLFESGSSSWFELKSDDLKGWNKYIGKGGEAYENPNFGSAYEIQSPDKAGSYLLVYNYYNANIDGSAGAAEKQRALSASKLLQSKDARAYMSTALDRSEFVRYFSKTIDELGEDGKPGKSQMLRNTYTGTGVSEHLGVDYTKYVAAEYVENTTKNSSVEASNNLTVLDDGQDPYMGKSQELVNKSEAKLVEDIKTFINENDIQTTEIKGYQGERVVLKLILSPSNNTSMNPYINLMMKKFNAKSGNPIYIETKTMSSTDEYKTEGSKGATDLFMSGWSPDYKDPSSFLETVTLTGPYRGYNGTSRLFKSKKSNGESSYEGTVEGNNYVLANPELKTKATKDLLSAFESYSEGYKQVDTQVSEPDARYKGFAEQEYNFFYDQFLALPLYTKAMPKVWTVNYLKPYTKSYESFGTAQFKLYNVEMDSQLGNREYYKDSLEAYEKAKKIVSEDWIKNRKGAHWKVKTDENGNPIKSN
ncbi:ABC transporter substrate-binding protein [Spiroplasma endosymbiont of Diplazon laetatorius]|uniref:ABC transporter substrate-binding protein n=1 Tax=Spiroplasma endosymbiont of Diplazon laetatorius TaxID=3066322 RepID=UPI0030D5748B